MFGKKYFIGIYTYYWSSFKFKSKDLISQEIRR